MKKIFVFALFVLLFSGCAQRTPKGRGAATTETGVATGAGSSTTSSETAVPYTVAEMGPHSRLWQQVLSGTNSVNTTNSYLELKTGLAYLDQTTGQLQESQENFEFTPDGHAVARRSQHQVIVSPSLTSPDGVVDLLTPDGKRIRSGIVGLNLFDPATGNSLQIAGLRNPTPVQTSPNSITWFDALDGLGADVRVRNEIGQFHQEVVLREKFSPQQVTALGFDPRTVQLEVWTAFLEAPTPTVLPEGAAVNAGSHAEDSSIDFGTMQFGRGTMFAETDPDKALQARKQWLQTTQGVYLVEAVKYADLLPLLTALPIKTAALEHEPSSLMAGRSPPRRSPAMRQGNPQFTKLDVAKPVASLPGVTLDYVLLNTSQSNFTFKADSTYFISGSVSLSGTTTIESCTVLKFTNSSSATLSLSGPLVCQTAPLRMAVLTSRNDNTAGETISGSTGSPTNFSGATYLSGASGTYRYLRFLYAGTAISGNVQTTGTTGGVWHCQFVGCGTGIVSDNHHIDLHNLLFSKCGTAVSVAYSGDLLRAEHVTADQTGTLFNAGTNTGSLTNSILTAVTNFGLVSFYNCATNASSAGFYQTVGGASYYLAADSTNRNAGTANISPTLLADLQHKTTYPPLVYSNATISVDTTFGPQAQRDTDTPDLGYEYDPLDWVFGGTTANANITFSPGTAVGWFRTSSGWQHAGHGIHMADTMVVTFDGRVDAPDYWVRCNVVQEGANGLWQGGYGPGGITGWAWPDIANSPQIVARFTRFSMVAGDGNHYRDDWGWLIANATSCEFYGGSVGFYNGGHHYTNSLFVRTPIGLSTDHAPSSFSMRNCTTIGSVLTPGRSNDGTNSPVVIRETAWDGTTVTTSGAGVTNTYYDYNACQSTNRTTPTGAHDQLITNFNWQTSWLGSYYLPTNSSLIDAGGVTADAIGLYHYTTQTNQVKEANSVVDLSYHYVAVDGNGKPIDANADGIPDYLSDPNGNGLVDSGEIGWNITGDLGLKVLITEPKPKANIP